MEASGCSQFENHVRAVMGWPLGSTGMVAPAAVMVNLIGTRSGPGRPSGMERALAVPGARVHIYGKSRCEPGRKMGHVTALGANLADAEKAALTCAQEIQFGI
jgi:5-(carboxyamino)imidazole ribonucleotide synthase